MKILFKYQRVTLRRSTFLSGIFSLCAAIILNPAGCGSAGGTSGTGGGGFAVSGLLRTAANVPVSGVRVSIVGTNAPAAARMVRVVFSPNLESNSGSGEDVTDAQGRFDLSLGSRPDSFRLLFQSQNAESVVDVISVPTTAAKANLELEFDEENESVSEKGERFEDENGDDVTGEDH